MMQRYDIIWTKHGPYPEYHFCREWDEDGGCYGTNPGHGYTWEEVREEIAQWHEGRAQEWREMNEGEWNG